MENFVWINGEICEASTARISVFDRGFMYGDGLFETMRVEGGGIHMLGRHLRRMRDGARMLDMTLPSGDELIDALRETIAANNIDRCVVRLTVTRGEGIGASTSPARTTTVVTLRPLLQVQDVDRHASVISLTTAYYPPETVSRVKSLSYLCYVLGAREAAARSADEGVFTSGDHVAEGTVSNVFVVRDGALLTPPLALGILPGIARARILEIAHLRGIDVREELFDIPFMRGADECFYSNAARVVVPIGAVDGCVLPDARPITTLLRTDYEAEIAREWL